MVALWLSYRCIFVNRYAVSRRGRSNESSNISTTRLYKKSEEVISESGDQDEIQDAKSDVICAPPTTAISIQENPAYEINKAQTTT